MKTAQEEALEIAKILEDSKAEDVSVIDVSELNSWTDFFVIATIHSSAHWQGLAKQIKDYVKENEM
ncbi:MAG: RsfS/YbeB/iojap family protein, partial [Treponema sp.]|uniref:RsfS/YbeB/iojap family protein n=1 Tax=Treponema sp. TaxID=166 RepID=UPI002A917B9C